MGKPFGNSVGKSFRKSFGKSRLLKQQSSTKSPSPEHQILEGAFRQFRETVEQTSLNTAAEIKELQRVIYDQEQHSKVRDEHIVEIKSREVATGRDIASLTDA